MLLLLAAGTASAQVYRWVDAEGRVHFSDEPPAGIAPDRVELLPGPSATLGSGQESACVAARMDLAVLEMDRPVYRESDGRLGVFWAVGSRPNYYEGERRYLEDDERRELQSQARAIIDRDCADPDDAGAQRAAEAAWLHAEDCRAMRVELEQLRRPQMRTAETDLVRKQREADEFCAAY